MLTNIISDYLFAYPLTSLAEKLGVYKMGKMSRKQLFLLSIAVAIINYLYQALIVEKPRREQSNRNNEP